MRVELKDDRVSLLGLDSRLTWMLFVVIGVWEELGLVSLVVTSGSEPSARHGATSLHYDGRALDIRSRGTHPDLAVRRQAAQMVHSRCGIDIDFLLEDAEGQNEHFHGEVQPKRRV